nr:MAG TPA: zinc-ribbon domain protein [Caudoviricetes sp.]
MYCANCGKKNHDGAKFCVNCGKPIAPEKPAPEPDEYVKKLKHERKKTIMIIAPLCVLAVIAAIAMVWRFNIFSAFVNEKKSETAIARDKVVEICEAYLDGEYTEDEAKYMLDLVEIPNTTGGDFLATRIGRLKTQLGLLELPLGGDDTSEFERLVNDTKKMTVDYPALDAEREAETATQTPSLRRDDKDAALEDAHGYLSLDRVSLSYETLINQLVYEGYSESTATYAADNCGADWYAQAVKAAQFIKEDLHGSDLDYDDLVFFLEIDGFTEDQAIYGADYVYSK